MPIDKLLEIHYGKAQSQFDAGVVAVATEQALDKLGAIEILELARKSGSEPILMSYRRSAYHPKPVSAAMETADIVIRARVNRVELDVSDTKAALLIKETNRHWYDHFPPSIRADVELEVLEAYPRLPGDGSSRLMLQPVFNTSRLDRLKQGKEYIIALHEREQVIWMLSYNEGIYQVEPNSGLVSGFRGNPMTLDDAWNFICDCYDTTHEEDGPSQETLNYWTDKLQSDDLTDCWTAVEYFNTLAEPSVPPDILSQAIAKHKDMRLKLFEDESNYKQVRQEQYQRGTFENEANKLLSRVEPKQLSQAENRRQLLESLPGAGNQRWDYAIADIGKTGGEDVEQLLLDMLEEPEAFGITYAHHLRPIWNVLARRNHPGIGPYLKQFLNDPNNTDLGVQHYNDNPRETVSFAFRALKLLARDDASRKEYLQYVYDYYHRSDVEYPININLVINTMRDFLAPGDTDYNAFLMDQVGIGGHWGVPMLIAERVLCLRSEPNGT
jgi:hypothetical protein